MLCLKSITIRQIEPKLKKPFKTANDTIDIKKTLLLESNAEDVKLYSECVALPFIGYTSENIETARHCLVKKLIPNILNKEFDHPNEVSVFLDTIIKDNQMAKAAIEMLYWQLASIQAKKSLAQFIGGTQKKVAVGLAIGIQENNNDTLEKIKAALEKGYQKIKLKFGPTSNLNLIQAIRTEFGNNCNLMIDANRSFNPNDIALLKTLDSYNLTMIEQPFDKNKFQDHANLQKQLNTSICLDESIESLKDAQHMIKTNAGRIINIKPGRVGGFATALSIHDLCKRNNIPVWCGGMLETGIGRAYNIALASLDNFNLPGDLAPSAHYWEQDLVIPEWEMNQDGTITVPFNKIGLGVEINEELLKKLTKEKLTLI
tara:strand:+ start:341 stop:1459 length:1119 start_codon:yes stop_codon:yes gene_type:complete